MIVGFHHHVSPRSCGVCEWDVCWRVFSLLSCAAKHITDYITAVNSADPCVTPGAIPSASCTASTEYSASYSCDKAVNGNAGEWATRGQGAGSWIETRFPGQFLVTKLEYQQRAGNEKNKGITVDFCDGSSQSFTLQNTNSLQTFVVAPVRTVCARLKVTSHYTAQNNGAKIIRFSGCKSTGRSQVWVWTFMCGTIGGHLQHYRDI